MASTLDAAAGAEPPAATAAGAVWGLTASVGAPVSLELSLTGGGGGGDAPAVITGWAISAVPDDGVPDAAVEGGEAAPDDPAVAVAGVLRGVRLGGEGGDGEASAAPITSPASLVFLRPGLFRVAPRAPRVEGEGVHVRVGGRALYVRAE
jgi:hypothetical protein